MKTLYKIIWIDDQYDEQASFIDQAEREGFDIVPFRTSREGMSFLRDNLHDVDALILDAKVFTESTADTASERGLIASLTKIASLSGQNNGKEIPHVIFTGQPDLCDDDAFAEKMNGIPVFSKNKSNAPLFEKLRELIGESISATLRNRYTEGYAACEWLERDCWRMLFPILDSMRSGVKLMSDPYNDLRKVVEIAFRKLHDAKIIHERLIENGNVILQGCSIFLAGMDANLRKQGDSVKAKARVTPKLVGDQLKFVLDVCQVGSHTQSDHEIPENKPSILEVEKWNTNHQLLETATLMTLDFIVWAKAYVDANPDPILNMANWEPISQCEIGSLIKVEGEVISVNRGGNAFVKTDHLEETGRRNVCIGSWLVNNNELGRGVRVRVTTSGKLLENGALAADSYICL
jgi:hypothetical protein